MWDICFPKKNEKKFAEVAEQLGYEGLICIYEKKPAKLPKTKIKLVAVTPKHEPKLVEATDKTRHLIESQKAGIIYHLEMTGKKDYVHHRGSGLNHVLANLLKKKKQAIGFAFSNLLHSTPKKRGVLMGRIRQNIQLCRKYKVPMVVCSFATRPLELRAPKDLLSFYTKLGMHPKEVKDGWKYLQERSRP